MAYADAFAYIVYFSYLTAILGILVGAIFLARGDTQRGKKYIIGAAVIVFTVSILPAALDYILGPSYSPPTAGNVDAYANFIYPYPDYAAQTGSIVTLYYSHPFQETASIVLLRLNFSSRTSGTDTYWYLHLPPLAQPISYPLAQSPYVVVYYPSKIDNNGPGSMVSKTYTADAMVVTGDINVINIASSNNATFTASYILGAQGTSVTYVMVFNYIAPKNESGGGVVDRLKNWGSSLVNGILHLFEELIYNLGYYLMKYLPFLTGEETMIYFTLLPTDSMLSSSGDVIKNFYYNTSLPWGMVILLATALLSSIDRFWNGDDNLAFSLAKDITAAIIWMVGGYYFYMAFANFINSIIISIGIDAILKMGYYIDLLIGSMIIYGLISLALFDNATGTYMGMLMFAVGIFQAIAFMRFFLIAAAVALFPLIAPWGLLKNKTGVSGDGIIRGIVQQGIYGILIAGLLKIVFTLASLGGSVGAGAMLLPIAFLFSPTMIHQFVGAMASGNFGHDTAHKFSMGVKSNVQKAGLTATGMAASKVATARAKRGQHALEDEASRSTIIADVEAYKPRHIEYEEETGGRGGTGGRGVTEIGTTDAYHTTREESESEPVSAGLTTEAATQGTTEVGLGETRGAVETSEEIAEKALVTSAAIEAAKKATSKKKTEVGTTPAKKTTGKKVPARVAAKAAFEPKPTKNIDPKARKWYEEAVKLAKRENLSPEEAAAYYAMLAEEFEKRTLKGRHYLVGALKAAFGRGEFKDASKKERIKKTLSYGTRGLFRGFGDMLIKSHNAMVSITGDSKALKEAKVGQARKAIQSAARTEQALQHAAVALRQHHEHVKEVLMLEAALEDSKSIEEAFQKLDKMGDEYEKKIEQMITEEAGPRVMNNENLQLYKRGFASRLTKRVRDQYTNFMINKMHRWKGRKINTIKHDED